MVALVYERQRSGAPTRTGYVSWPSNAMRLDALTGRSTPAWLTLDPDPKHVLWSLGDVVLRRAPPTKQWKHAARQIAASKKTEANALILVRSVLRQLAPIVLRYFGVTRFVQPCELLLQTGHVCTTLPRAICSSPTPSGRWKGIAYRLELYNPHLPELVPIVVPPPCSVCGEPSVDCLQCLCAAHNMLADTSLWGNPYSESL